MAGEFFPRRDGALLGWSAMVADRLLASSQEYPLPPGMAQSFAAAQEAFALAYTRAINPETATPSAVFAKREAREQMIRRLREINAILKALPEMTPQRLVNLGLNRRGRGGRSPRVPRPDSAPTVVLDSVRGNTARLHLLARETERRGRPRGAKGANLYWHAGPVAPTAQSQWRFLTDTLRTRLTVRFPTNLSPGARVWIVSRWKNARLQCGPASAPLGLNLPGDAEIAPPTPLRPARAA